MLKIRLKERLFILFFALFLAIYPPVVKYQEVQAMEWIGTEVSFTTALKFILGLLGVSVAHEVTDDWWEQTWNDCFDYTMEDQTQTMEQVNEWWDNLKKGSLDTASSVWSRVKEWVTSKLQDDTTGGSSTSAEGVYNAYCNYFGVTPVITDFTIYDGYEVYASFGRLDSNNRVIVNFLFSDCTYTYRNGMVSGSIEIFDTAYISYKTVGVPYQNRSLSVPADAITNNILNSPYTEIDISGGESATSDFEGVKPDVNDLDVINDDATDLPTDTDSETTIPMPWENAGETDTDAQDTIDALQEQVAEGVLSLEEYCEKVQELLEVIVFDITTETTFPTTTDPDTGEDEKVDEKLEENRENMAFTIGGLEKVFPFCIPWDIYAFVTLLVAEPVAPVINYPFYNPVSKQNINIIIDFSKWQSVVVVFRYIFDFLLIIGLLLLARQLAGAGGDD